jgi:ferredoxin--NADP+ reductase
MEVNAPHISKKAKAGQFIIFRVDEFGERVPLTVADCNPQNGTVTIIFQVVGKSTVRLAEKNAGDTILDFAGPLGKPTHLADFHKVCVVGGGVGCAIAYASVKALSNAGAVVDTIAGFRNQSLVFLEKEFQDLSRNLYITTDDGSYGKKAFVTDKLHELLQQGETYDAVIAIGPIVMMKAVCALTAEHKIKTLVSLNPIMIDGTGMCGCCRVTVGGKLQFACADGPDFDGHQVDFDELMKRNQMYVKTEREKAQDHECKLMIGQEV